MKCPAKYWYMFRYISSGFIKGRAPANWLAVKTILPAWTDHLVECFSNKKAQLIVLPDTENQVPSYWNVKGTPTGITLQWQVEDIAFTLVWWPMTFYPLKARDLLSYVNLLFFRGHRGTIWSMVSKGHRLFSAGGDKVIKVWNMENVRLARCTEVLEGHTNDVSEV